MVLTNCQIKVKNDKTRFNENIKKDVQICNGKRLDATLNNQFVWDWKYELHKILISVNISKFYWFFHIKMHSFKCNTTVIIILMFSKTSNLSFHLKYVKNT